MLAGEDALDGAEHPRLVIDHEDADARMRCISSLNCSSLRQAQCRWSAAAA